MMERGGGGVSSSKELRRYVHKETKSVLAMECEQRLMREGKKSCLRLAVQGYTNCLQLGGEYDMQALYRIVSLWFNHSGDVDVVESMKLACRVIPSYKFIPLSHQIVSRMGADSTTGLDSVVYKLVKRLTCDHPYHMLYLVFALVNGDLVRAKSSSSGGSSSRSSSSSRGVVVNKKRKAAADRLIKELKSPTPLLADLFENIFPIFVCFNDLLPGILLLPMAFISLAASLDRSIIE